MNTINLSKFVLSEHRFEILKEENIDFDQIITDNEKLAKTGNAILINEEMHHFFSHINPNTKLLIILDSIGIKDIVDSIGNKFSSIKIISTFSHTTSLGRKISPEINYLGNELLHNFTLYYPRDLKNFLDCLKLKGNIFLPISNTEIPENIYASSTENDEGIQFIDKNLIEKKNYLSLLDPDNPEIFIIGFGNHFEELIKLSQFLSQESAKITVGVTNERKFIFSKDFKEKIFTAKKIIIIIDHLPTESLKKELEGIHKNIIFISPTYKDITSIFSEYQFEQGKFNAQSLYGQILTKL